MKPAGSPRGALEGERVTARRTGPGDGRAAASHRSDAGDPDSIASSATSLSAAAVRGSIWNTAQIYLNKLATGAAVLVIALFLSPSDYGVAATALAVAALLLIFPPDAMADVLVAYPGRHRLLAASARRLAAAAAATSALATWLAIPLVVLVYHEYPSLWLAGLLAVLAIHPLCMAVAVVPLARLRQRLMFHRIALIEGVTQFLATLLSVGCAALGAKAASLVVPQVLNQVARTACYVSIGAVDRPRRFHRKIAAVLLRSYLPMAAAQYIHGVLALLEIIVLGYLAGKYEAGLFALAYMLAKQANVLVVGKVGMVLQSVFGELQTNPSRQADAFLRAQRVLAAVCVPICLLQAAFAEPLFELALSDKWQPAIPVFQVLSLAQAFYFAFGPCTAALKSQRRFTTLLGWQGAQMLISLPVFWFGVRQGGAVGVALASLALWSISVLVGVSLCMRFAGRRGWRQVASIFVQPWLIGLAAAAVALLAVQWLEGAGRLGSVVALCVVAPVLFGATVFVTRWASAEFRAAIDAIWQELRSGRRRLKNL